MWARAAIRARAEQAWLDFGAAHGVAVHVFRLAGIYGPGRSALAQLAAGDAADIDLAVAGARTEFESGSWSRRSPAVRKRHCNSNLCDDYLPNGK